MGGTHAGGGQALRGLRRGPRQDLSKAGRAGARPRLLGQAQGGQSRSQSRHYLRFKPGSGNASTFIPWSHLRVPSGRQPWRKSPPTQISEPIVVDETLKDPHRLVVLSGRYLAKAHPTNGVVSVSGHTCLDIQVSPESLDRALRIFDALIKALEAAALKVEVAVVEEAEPTHRYDYRPLDRAPHRPARVTRVHL